MVWRLLFAGPFKPGSNGFGSGSRKVRPMELSQRPEVRQKVTLSPQVYQGLSILAMPLTELQAVVDAELMENPVLEMEEAEESADEEEERTEETEDDAAWDEWLAQYEELAANEPVVPRDPNAEDVDTEDFVGSIQSFDDYLLEQIAMLDLEEDVARAARAIVGSLDHDGFFTSGLSEVAEIAAVDCGTAARALVEDYFTQLIERQRRLGLFPESERGEMDGGFAGDEAA